MTTPPNTQETKANKNRNTNKKFLKWFGLGVGIIVLLIIIAAITTSGDESTVDEQPVSESEQQAQDNVDTTDAVYEETYEAVLPHITANYGITEQAELCQTSAEPGPEYDALIDDLMTDAGVDVEGDTREDPDYRGAYDATDDVIYDLCEEYNS